MTQPRRLARVLAMAMGATWVILTVPALGLAGFAMIVGNPGTSVAYSMLVHTCMALPALTVFAAVGSFKGAAQGNLRSAALYSAGPLAAGAFGALMVLAGA